MDDQPDAVVKSGHEFAEIAEALGIRTFQIMGAEIGPDRVVAVYTPELEAEDLDPHTPLYVALLRRDLDRILRVVGEPKLTEFDWVELNESIRKRLEEEFGEHA